MKLVGLRAATQTFSNEETVKESHTGASNFHYVDSEEILMARHGPVVEPDITEV